MATKIRLSNLTQPLDQDLSVPGLSSSGNITLPTDARVVLGDSSEMQIFLNNNGNGIVDGGDYLRVRATQNVKIQNDNSTADMAEFVVGGAATLFYNDNPKVATSNTGISVTGDVVASGNLSGVDATLSGDLTVSGDFTVSGNTTFINSDNLAIEDLNIVLANGAANSAIADGAGITIDGANAQITYNSTDDSVSLNKLFKVSYPGVNARFGDSTYNNEIVITRTVTNPSEVRVGAFPFTGQIRYSASYGFAFSDITSGSDVEQMRIRNGRLGIGYNNPQEWIHILGNSTTPNVGIRLQSHDTANAIAKIDLYSRDASNVNQAVAITNYAGKLNVDSSVGLGTITNPLQNFAIEADANYDPPGLGNSDGTFSILKADGNNSGAYGLLTGIQSSGDVWAQVQRVDGTATGYHLKLQPSGGKVGVGTTWDTPIGNLDVNGQIALTTTGTGSRFIGFYQDVVSAANNALSGFIEKNGDNFTISNITNGTIQIANNGATRMRIANTGNVSIGGNNPYNLLWPDGSTGALSLQANVMMSAYNNALYLSQNYYYNAGEKYITNGYASRYSQVDGKHVFAYAGNNTNGADYQFASWNDGLIVDNNGNVGIGTNQPTATYGPTLNIKGGNPSVRLEGTGNGSWAYLELENLNFDRAVGMATDGSFRITNDKTNLDANIQFRVEQNGNVGIGIPNSANTAQHTLDVAGDINAQSSFRTDEVRHNISPSFSMDFANSKTIPPEFVVRRGGDVGSYASYWDENGTLKYAPANTARITHDPETGECKGVILEKSQYNKLLESETFSEWDTAGNGGFPVRRVYNYAKAPDGSFNATRLMPSETTARQVIYRIVSSALDTAYTASVFAKPDGYTRLQLSMIYGANSAGWGWGFELDLNDVVGDSATYLQSENSGFNSVPSVEYVGDGWYRCSVSFTNSSSIAVNYFNIGVGGEQPFSSDPFYKTINSQGNNQDGLLVWGAQFEESPFLSSYIPSDVYFSNRNSSKTYFDEEGVLQIAPANVATEGWNSPYQETHFGVDPSDNIVVAYNKPATVERYPLTIASPNRELGSTNIFSRGIGGWGPGGNIGTVFGAGGKIELAVNEVAPDGTIGNVSKVTFANNSDRLDQQHGTAVNGTYYTISAWVKGTAGTAVRMSILHALGGNIEPTFYLTGEWQRISVTRYFDSSVDPSTTVRTHTLIIRDVPGAGVTTIDGQSAVYASEVLIWGIQLENTEFPTALIPTYGTNLTRADDILTYAAGLRYEDQAVVYLKDTDWFNLKEGTIFADVEMQNAFDDAATSTIFGLTNSEDQGTTNALVQFHTSSTGGRIWLRSGSSGGTKDGTVGKPMRIATSYDASTVEASFVDGSGTVDTFSSVTRSNAIVPKYIMFNEEVASGYQHGFTMKQFVYYPKALSTLSNLVEE